MRSSWHVFIIAMRGCIWGLQHSVGCMCTALRCTALHCSRCASSCTAVGAPAAARLQAACCVPPTCCSARSSTASCTNASAHHLVEFGRNAEIRVSCVLAECVLTLYAGRTFAFALSTLVSAHVFSVCLLLFYFCLQALHLFVGKSCLLRVLTSCRASSCFKHHL